MNSLIPYNDEEEILRRRMYGLPHIGNTSLLPAEPTESHIQLAKVLKSTTLKKAAIESIAATSQINAAKAGEAVKVAVAQGVLDRKKAINIGFDSNFDHDKGSSKRKNMRLSWRLKIWTS